MSKHSKNVSNETVSKILEMAKGVLCYQHRYSPAKASHAVNSITQLYTDIYAERLNGMKAAIVLSETLDIIDEIVQEALKEGK